MGRSRAIWYIFYLVIATLLMAEMAVRVWGYSERYIYDPIYVPFEQSSAIPFVHRPLLLNARARSNTWFSTDSLGLRSAHPCTSLQKQDDSEFVIAFVGNSTTFGQGVRTEETFCVLVKKILNEKRKRGAVRTFNFGVSGYSVKEMAATVRYRVLAVRPDLLVVGASYDDFDSTRCGGVDRWGYNVSHRMSEDVSKNSLLKLALRPMHLAYVLRDIKFNIERTWKHTEDSRDTTLPSSYGFLQTIGRFADQNRLAWFLVALPMSSKGGEQFSGILTHCRTDGIDVLDLSPLGRGIPAHLYNVGKYDSHSSALVHKRIAEKISAYIEERYFLPSALGR